MMHNLSEALEILSEAFALHAAPSSAERLVIPESFGAPPAAEWEELSAAIGARPDATEVPLPSIAPVRLAVWAPGIYLVSPKGRAVAAHGVSAPVSEESFALDARTEPAGLLVETEEASRALVVLFPGELFVARLEPSGIDAHALGALDVPALTLPPVEAILGEERLDAELLDEVRTRGAVGDPYEVACAMGIVARHFRPAPRSFEEILILAGPTPLGRAQRWAAALDPAVRDLVVGTGLEEVDALHDRLDDVAEAAAARAPGATALAQSWLRCRDDLEGIRVLFTSVALEEALESLDEALLAAVDPFLDLGDLADDPRLAVAAWTEADRPWARLLATHDAESALDAPTGASDAELRLLLSSAEESAWVASGSKVHDPPTAGGGARRAGSWRRRRTAASSPSDGFVESIRFGRSIVVHLTHSALELSATIRDSEKELSDLPVLAWTMANGEEHLTRFEEFSEGLYESAEPIPAERLEAVGVALIVGYERWHWSEER